MDWSATPTGGFFANSTEVPSNSSTEAPPWKVPLMKFYRVSLILLLIVVMVAMGCTITLKEVWAHLRRPVGLAIGACGQFVLMPLLAFGVAQALSLGTWEAIGTLIIATCPGGTTSNIFTYWAEGDVPLSLTMTTVSTLLSFGMMPFNLWLYCRFWTSDQAVIPYVNIVITLVSILAPVSVGVLIRHKNQKVAKIVTKVGNIGLLIFIVVVVVVQLLLFPEMLKPKWQIAVMATCLPLIGFTLSYVVALACRRSQSVCRTIGIETACQNAPMAVTVAMLSFPIEVVGMVSLPPMLYGTIMVMEGYLISGTYKIVRLCQARKRREASADDDDDDDYEKDPAAVDVDSDDEDQVTFPLKEKNGEVVL